MHAVEGVVDIDDKALRRRAERAAILLDEGPPKAQQSPSVGEVFQPRDRRLRAQLFARRQTIQRQLKHRVPRSLSASLPSSYPAAIISMRNRMISAKRCTTLSGARGSTRQLARRSDKPSRRSISRSASKPPSDDSRPPSKRATTALP